MEATSARSRAAVWLVVPLLVAVSVVGGVASPAHAQGTLREAAADDGMFVGAALANNLLGNATYANIAGSQFSSVTAENSMKWDTTEPSQGNFNFGPGDQIVNFAQQNDQHVYGHTLVWHSQTPQWVQNLNGAQMTQAMQNHINALLQRWPNVGRWDVVNEVISDNNGQLRNSFWLQTMGTGYIDQAFDFARAADPNATLCMNDYSIEGINTKSNAYFNLVQQLRSQGTPINCMSFQAHLILGQVPGDMQQNLERFAALPGIDEVWITELDIRIPEPVSQQELQQQAADYARVFEICQNVPDCAGVTTWGVHDAQSWVDSTFPEFDAPLLWDDNFQPKPAFEAVLQQLGGEGDDQPPLAPSGLQATPGQTNISLSWNASTGAGQYQILRAPGASGGTFTQIGTTSSTSFNNTGLPTNTTFRYQVTASNPNGTSPPSNTVTATTGTPGPGGCTAAATVQNQWGEGYVIQPVTVTNTGSSTTTSWNVSFDLPAGHTIVNMWNARPDATTGAVEAANMPYNGTLSPNGSTTFGFQVSRPSGNTQTPTGYTCSSG
jgi:endo-1,4-beta-xylanase